MTEEQLDRGKVIKAQLYELRTHRKMVENIRNVRGVYFRIDTSTTFVKLKETYCPMSFTLFTEKYIENLNIEMSDLEKEFASL